MDVAGVNLDPQENQVMNVGQTRNERCPKCFGQLDVFEKHVQEGTNAVAYTVVCADDRKHRFFITEQSKVLLVMHTAWHEFTPDDMFNAGRAHLAWRAGHLEGGRRYIKDNCRFKMFFDVINEQPQLRSGYVADVILAKHYANLFLEWLFLWGIDISEPEN